MNLYDSADKIYMIYFQILEKQGRKRKYKAMTETHGERERNTKLKSIHTSS